jgi:osmotically inducible lipoprotein OsmB
MRIRNLIAPALLASAFALGACADNYAVEGAVAGAAAGAGIAAVTGGEIDEGAAIGAAAGGIGGALIEKDGRCYRRDRDGREYEVSCRD